MKLGLSIPLLDEEALVKDVARSICAVLDTASIPFVLALVDNGSTDRTGDCIEALAASDPRIMAVHLARNAGYGGGILAGITALQQAHRPDVIGWAWGDDQIDPAILPALMAHCQRGSPLAKARRTVRQDGFRRRLITMGYATVMRTLGVQTADVNGCPKLIRADAFASLNPSATDWFLDAEVVLGCEHRGWIIAQEPATMRPRSGGESKVKVATLLEFGANLLRWKTTGSWTR